MNTSTKLGCVLAFLLYASVFQLLVANEEAKSSDELNILQLPLSKEFVSDALDEVIQVVTTRYDQSHFMRPKKVGFCLRMRYCSTDADCKGAICGPLCYNDPLMHSWCSTSH